MNTWTGAFRDKLPLRKSALVKDCLQANSFAHSLPLKSVGDPHNPKIFLRLPDATRFAKVSSFLQLQNPTNFAPPATNFQPILMKHYFAKWQTFESKPHTFQLASYITSRLIQI